MCALKNAALLVAALANLAVHSACAADPLPGGKPSASPTFQKSPPSLAPERPLPDPVPIPASDPIPSLLPDEIPRDLTRPRAPKPLATLQPLNTVSSLDLRIRYRKARTAAESNDKVRAAWERTRNPESDQQKRDTLRRYYDLLFEKMLGMDRGIAPLVEARRKAETAALTQKIIAPTIRND